VSLRRATIVALCLGAAACSRTTSRGDEFVPMIAVEQRGLAERLAQMDRFRLHDEDRKHMMQRPHVTVEEIPDEEPADADADAGAP